MDDEHSPIRHLKHLWDEEDKTRDELERHAKRAFVEQEANELFAPLENYLTKLEKVLHQANAAVEIDPTWEHLDERKLRRTAKVMLRETAQQLPLDLTIEGVTIFYRNRPYRFTRAIEALIPVITSDVEQFITAQKHPADDVDQRRPSARASLLGYRPGGFDYLRSRATSDLDSAGT